jgi:hypothetical protein
MNDPDLGPEGRLLAEAVAVLRRAERVPADVVAAANAAFSWRSTALAIADLEFDSVLDDADDDDLARVRDIGTDRRLRFRGSNSVVEVTVIESGRRLVGRIEPPLPGRILLCRPGGSTNACDVDALGQFFFDAVPRGAISLRPVPADPALLGFETEWVTI